MSRALAASFLLFIASLSWGQTAAGPAPATAPKGTIGSYCEELLPTNGHRAELNSACLFAMTVATRMPNYVCKMKVERSFSFYADPTRRNRQIVLATSRFVDGVDHYFDVTIDGDKSNEDAIIASGVWSRGEFGAKLMAAFSPLAKPKYRFTKQEKMRGTPSLLFQFHVDLKDNKAWNWSRNELTAHPEYKGKVWLNASNSRIEKVELNSLKVLPDKFPIQHVISTTDFQWVDFHDGTGFVLPSKANIEAQLLDGRTIYTTVEFMECQKFRAKTQIFFDPKEEPAKDEPKK